MKTAAWLLLGACAAVLALRLYEELRQAGRGSAVVRVHGTDHDRYCLVARYPDETSPGFPWCTCAWRASREQVPGG